MGLQFWSIAAIVVVVLVIAWRRINRPVRRPAVFREGQSPVVSVRDDDEAVNAAMALARKSIPQLIEWLTDPAKKSIDCSVKIRVEQGDVTEHIWMDYVTYDGVLFHGFLGNVPLDLEGMALGDHVTATADELSDWIIVDGDDLRGGFTTRVFCGDEDLSDVAADPMRVYKGKNKRGQ